MTEVAVDVSGSMTPQTPPPKTGFSSLLQLPTQLPDPKDWLANQRQNVRPWLTFAQTTNFKAPPSLPRLTRRIIRNIEYFQSNYVFVFLGLIIYCLITSPLLLIAIACSFYVGYKLSLRHANPDKRIVLFGNQLSLAQQYGIVALCSMPVFYLVGATGVIFWVIGASFTLIMLHAAFYNIDALMTNEDEFGLLQEV